MSTDSSDDFWEKPDPVTLDDLCALERRLVKLWRRVGWRPIVNRAMQLIREQCELRAIKEPLIYLRSKPWIVHRLAQWVLADKECTSIGLTPLSDQIWHQLLELTYEYGDSLAMRYLLQTQSVNSLRAMAYQQFIYQTIKPNGVLRQSVLLSKLADNHRINQYLKQINGLVVQEIVYLGYCFSAAATKSRNGRFNLGKTKNDWFPRNKVIGYANRMSATFDDLRVRIPSNRGISLETSLQHPFFCKAPLVRISNGYQAWAPNFVVHAAVNFVENSLRDAEDTSLLAEFATQFEQYILLGLKSISAIVFTESELKSALPFAQKIVDFIVATNEHIVLIESKYKVDDPKAQVDRSLERVGERYRESFMKALAQASATIKAIESNFFAHLFSSETKEIFCIIVTSAQHYMGSGEQFASQTGGARVKTALTSSNSDINLPLSNVILLSADGFDLLVRNIECGQITLDHFLKKMKASRTDPHLNTLTPEQLLDNARADLMPKHLESEQAKVDAFLCDKYPAYTVKR